jgi:hypothetical protein
MGWWDYKAQNEMRRQPWVAKQARVRKEVVIIVYFKDVASQLPRYPDKNHEIVTKDNWLHGSRSNWVPSEQKSGGMPLHKLGSIEDFYLILQVNNMETGIKHFLQSSSN